MPIHVETFIVERPCFLQRPEGSFVHLSPCEVGYYCRETPDALRAYFTDVLEISPKTGSLTDHYFDTSEDTLFAQASSLRVRSYSPDYPHLPARNFDIVIVSWDNIPITDTDFPERKHNVLVQLTGPSRSSDYDEVEEVLRKAGYGTVAKIVKNRTIFIVEPWKFDKIKEIPYNDALNLDHPLAKLPHLVGTDLGLRVIIDEITDPPDIGVTVEIEYDANRRNGGLAIARAFREKFPGSSPKLHSKIYELKTRR